MGRYNNRRTQAAAAALKNTPSRARFSKGPPSKNKGRPKRSNADGNNADSNGKNDTSKVNNRGRNAATQERVVGKIQQRVNQQQQAPSRSATTAESLQYLDKSKLDYLKLPEEVLQNISNLLEALGVKEQEPHLRKVPQPTEEMDDHNKTAEISDDDIDEFEDNERAVDDPRYYQSQNAGGYTEYDEDYDESLPATFSQTVDGAMDWERSVDSNEDDEMGSAQQGADTSEQADASDSEDIFRDHPAFVYLSQRLSFSAGDALKACRAIEDLSAVTAQPTPALKDGENPSSTPNKIGREEAIALALDWLCLHLTETQLTKGFRPNPNPPEAEASTLRSKSGVPLVGTIKAVPHPSISLARDIVNDKVWAKSCRLQDRTLKFVRFGFTIAEATRACEATSSDVEQQDISLTKADPLEDPALLILLSDLNKDPANTPAIVDASALESAGEERNQEREALEAIYDDQLVIETDSALCDTVDKYMLQITPAEDLQLPAVTIECKLHAYLPRGYPTVQPGIFMFTNHSLAPSLLRRINMECTRLALENLGDPVVFEIVTFLTENLPELQLSFIREQRRKEFDAQQIRLRKASGIPVEEVIEAQYTADGKIGRRQRARLKAAEKSFNRSDQMQKEEEEWRRRQDERVEQAKSENKRVRAVHAEHAIQKRNEERMMEEAERIARSAMNKAFTDGAGVEEARAASEKARNAYLVDNGAMAEASTNASSPQTSTPSNIPAVQERQNTSDFMQKLRSKIAEEKDNGAGGSAGNDSESSAHSDTHLAPVEATANTAAFMERLRTMYDKATKKKNGYHLEAAAEDAIIPSGGEHVPCPVATGTGELGEVMNDIVNQQEEQPWLVSPEARVPARSSEISNEAHANEFSKKESRISAGLKEELLRKRRLASEWAKKYGDEHSIKSGGKNSKGFSAAKFHSMMSVRSSLPAFKMADDVVQTIEENQITVIAGDTGCGKTTQVPQLVLDDRILSGMGAATNIIVTQPRRISAIGVSERISDERCERVGETCGYSIKLERKTSSKTRLLLCTTGVLLRRLQCDPDLASVSHIFVDEVHERDLNTDFLIIILKDLLARRQNLKLVLMSATLNSDAFSTYFLNCPVVSIPGRAHPVKEFRLEDVLEMTNYLVEEGSDFALKISDSRPPKYSKSVLRRRYYPKYSKDTIHSLSIVDESVINYELVAALLEYISLNEDTGAILVFMPGMMEITKTIEEMYKKQLFQSDKVRIYPLHSSLSTSEQIAIFEVPPEGVRKIVVSTNIAETSITIEDVVFVVDAGRMKENRRDEINETPTLVECWVSRASAKQRRGRAGRVRPGTAYHLYSSHTHDSELQDYQLPEMLRVGIEDLVLQVLILDLGDPVSFLGKALNPPTDLAMSNSLKLLETLGAVECQWSSNGHRQREGASTGELKVTSELTALGFHLATLPVDPRVGKLMIYGSLLGCVDPALTIAASMSSRSPFVSPFDQREAADEARKTFAVEGSDHLTILNAFEQWKEMKESKGPKRNLNSFLKENFLGRMTLHQMEDLRKQFAKLLKDIGFLQKTYSLKNPGTAAENENAKNIALVKAVLCAGLYPNIMVGPRSIVSSSGERNNGKKAGENAFRSQRQAEVHLHPSTISYNQPSLDSRYCCYHEIVKTSKIYARDTTTVSPFALLLFGGTLKVYQTHGVCSVDHWLKFRLDAKPATLVKYLRGQLEKFLLQKIVNPQDEIVNSEEGKALIQSINLLFGNNEILPVEEPDRSAADIVRPWTGEDIDRSGRNGGGRGRGRGGRGRRNSRGGGRGRNGGRNSGRRPRN